MTDNERMKLIEAAKAAAEFSYSPYSNFKVGAALAAKSGRVYTGCNVENASYSPTVCAERTAFLKAVSEGERRFVGIAVVGGEGGDFSRLCPPCGVCRQFMSEFADGGFEIILWQSDGEMRVTTLSELLPLAFSGTAGK